MWTRRRAGISWCSFRASSRSTGTRTAVPPVVLRCVRARPAAPARGNRRTRVVPRHAAIKCTVHGPWRTPCSAPSTQEDLSSEWSVETPVGWTATRLPAARSRLTATASKHTTGQETVPSARGEPRACSRRVGRLSKAAM